MSGRVDSTPAPHEGADAPLPNLVATPEQRRCARNKILYRVAACLVCTATVLLGLVYIPYGSSLLSLVIACAVVKPLLHNRSNAIVNGAGNENSLFETGVFYTTLLVSLVLAPFASALFYNRLGSPDNPNGFENVLGQNLLSGMFTTFTVIPVSLVLSLGTMIAFELVGEYGVRKVVSAVVMAAAGVGGMAFVPMFWTLALVVAAINERRIMALDCRLTRGLVRSMLWGEVVLSIPAFANAYRQADVWGTLWGTFYVNNLVLAAAVLGWLSIGLGVIAIRELCRDIYKNTLMSCIQGQDTAVSN